MIPIKLTLQGLFSYQERQTIDFQRLTEAHLFGIFGSVGSGKSSILDAITYALYGETERMNARDNRNYNMMNLKSDELFIEFDFSTGNGSTIFRSVVRGKRNRKRFDDVKTLDRLAYKYVNGAWVPVQVEELQQVIGLSYVNFKRTIIIPQGQFQEFLQLGNKDRTQMMKELFNLEKFELYYKTVALETKNSEQLQKLEGQLLQLGEVKPEQLEAARFRLGAIRAELEQVTELLALKQHDETVLKQLKELVGKLKEQQTSYELLKTREVEVQKSELLLKEYEYCRNNFKNLFERSDEVGKGVEQLKRTIEIEESIQKDCTASLAVLTNDFEKLKADYEQRDLLKQQAIELRKIGRIIELKVENGKIGERIKKGEITCRDSIVKIQNLKLLQEEKSVELKKLKLQLPNLTELARVHSWFTIKSTMKANNQLVSEELETVGKEIYELNDRFITNISGLHTEAITNKKSRSEWLEYLAQKVAEIKNEIVAIDKNIEQLLIRDKLEEYATQLEDGKPCPLCGSLSHPDILFGGEVRSALQSARDSKLKLEKAIVLLEKAMITLRQIETQIHLKQESVQKLKLKQAEHQAKMAEHEALYVWPEFNDEGIVNQLMKDAESMVLSIKTIEGQLDQLMTETEKEQKVLEIYEKELDKIREKQTINQTEIATLSRQVEKLEIESYLQQSVEVVNQLSDSLLKKFSELESAWQKTNDAIILIKQKQKESSGKLQANQSILIQGQKNHIAINEQINQLLTASDYTSVDEIKNLLNQEIDVESERQRIQNFREQLQLLMNQIQFIQIEIGERTYVADDHQKLGDEVIKLKEVQSEKNRELGKMEGEIRKLTKDLEQQAEIGKKVDHLLLRSDDLKTLKQLFKGSGFVNYVSSVHLHNLCLAANDRFYKLVRQKMSLEITGDNNFQVRDYLNGGKVRSVKTLSGGQTFQAALSLALALADSIQQFTASSQNFFFLDEGFGSLDKESLNVVFETLKSLRKENRIVGVISHVEEMQQEIDTHLRIINNEETGSQVYRSWEAETPGT